MLIEYFTDYGVQKCYIMSILSSLTITTVDWHSNISKFFTQAQTASVLRLESYGIVIRITR